METVIEDIKISGQLSKPFWIVWAIELWERFGYYDVKAILALYFVQHLGYSEHQSSYVFGSFTAFVYGFVWIGGWIGDHYLGVTRTLVLGAIMLAFSYAALVLSNSHTIFAVLICSLGSILFGCVTSFYLGCLARLLMGVGSAFAFISVFVMASKLFHLKWFPFLTGITQMLAALGAMSGQLLVRLLVNDLGWRNTMYILGVLGIFLAVIITFLLNGSEYENSHRNLESRNEFNNIQLSLRLIIGNPQTWLIAIYACLLWAPMSGFASLWGAPFLEKFDGFSVNNAALYSSMMWLGLAVGSPLLGGFSTLVHNKVLPLILSSLVGVIRFSFVLFSHLHSVALILCLFLSGGACSGQALSFGLVKASNQQRVRGTAIAFDNMASFFVAMFFIREPICFEELYA